uniref:Uncharacterized protein n=2 Tax=Setaria viridis TaxID=4556 RepID=A0A4U6UYW0_SETVI|nr:hypothetical protein SEVIR_4G059501v2 [Setaria viridis]
MDGGGGRPSPDSLFAVLITDCAYQSVIYIFQSSAAAAFRVPGRERISDVALVDGKLYALSPKKLFVLEVDSSRKAGEPKTPSMKPIADAVDTPAPAGILYKTIAVRGMLVRTGTTLLNPAVNCCMSGASLDICALCQMKKIG